MTLVGDAALVSAGALAALATRRYIRFRDPRIVRCPETGRPAAVRLRAARAAFASLPGRPRLRVGRCSRWPARPQCRQPCVAEILRSPDGCRLRARLTQWYRERTCAFCHRPFASIGWHAHRPALLTPEGALLEWTDVTPEELVLRLESCQPVCWNCDVIETFRRKYPHLVTERPAPPRRDVHA